LIHKTDTVSVTIACSYAPVAIDINGLIRLSNAFTRVEARLSTLVNEHGYEKGVTALPIPEHNNWIATMWHFGADALIEYTGEKFSYTWGVGNNALVRVYSNQS
jgi:hypothetical protein